MTSPASDRPELDPPPTPPGAQLAAGYEVLEHVCRGEELDSFEAWSTDRHCRCFIKTLRPDYATDPAARRHLRQEAQILLALSHPHIARAYEFVQPADGAAPLLVCENLIGATLGYLLETEGRLGHADLGNLGQQLCSALRYLHERGFLHLDIKPSNIIASYGLARLIDFSLARPPGHVRRGVGTLGYMSPEQAVGGELGTATDVWGLGATLYEAATGAPPFPVPHGETLTQYVAQLNGTPPRIRSRRRLNPAVAQVLDECLRRNPRARPDLATVADALSTLSAETGQT
jgi:eukaryotic-like serine/threonine-protein kinase